MTIHKILQGDCLDILPTLSTSSIDIVITSPPYNVQKSYERKLSKEDYLIFTKKWISECKRVLTEKGRICVNVPNNIRIGGDGEMWSPSLIIGNILYSSGFRFFDIVIWNKNFCNKGTAWGSFASPSSPFIQHQAESILIFYKNEWKLQKASKHDITTNEFLEYIRSEIWRINPEPDRTHAAPYPEEIVYRLLKLFTYINDTVLDPFIGSGTTSVVAKKLGRNSIGIELNPEYVKMAQDRLNRVIGSEQTITKIQNAFEI